MTELLEYLEENGSLHLNALRADGLLSNEPYSFGWKPVCWMDDELKSDPVFAEFRYDTARTKVPYDVFYKLVNDWLEANYPGKKHFWKVDEKRLEARR